jgi:hypothetical protein
VFKHGGVKFNEIINLTPEELGLIRNALDENILEQILKHYLLF